MKMMIALLVLGSTFSFERSFAETDCTWINDCQDNSVGPHPEKQCSDMDDSDQCDETPGCRWILAGGSNYLPARCGSAE
jgi:hypothetical protein